MLSQCNAADQYLLALRFARDQSRPGAGDVVELVAAVNLEGDATIAYSSPVSSKAVKFPVFFSSG